MRNDNDELVVISWNIERNGRRRGTGDETRERAHRLMAVYEPHIVFRQELAGAWDNGKHDLYEEAEKLGGLSAFMATPKDGRSRKPVGVMFDPRLFQMAAHNDHDLPWKQVCHVQVRLRGCAKPLQLASAHLCHFSPELRAVEAARLTDLADHGRTALIGMDANSYPHRVADEMMTEPLDWEKVEDPVHYQQRTIERNGVRVPDTRPSEILTGGKGIYTDLAHHAGTALNQPTALKPTASLRRTDQGPPQRIDVIVGTPDLVPALRSIEIVDTDEVRSVTDHAMLVARFGLTEVHRILSAVP
ncbi:endonuclease/exonuclease/phosphatase family protein [Streptomyces sp. enrichment culture]|uniref:endonuclease/exonuclease/phosphatase family protein n=1 Tax=Streptomyces sp. enrichment culture TaxID=1795815 RepID=UPI003F56951D